LISLKNSELPVVINKMTAADHWKSENIILEKWKPSFSQSVAEYNDIFTNNNNQEVGLHISYYRQQNYERKLVTSTNDLLNTLNKNSKKIARDSRILNSIENLPSVETTTFQYRENSADGQYKNIQAWKFYWVNEKFTSNDIYAKVLGVISLIKGHGDDGAIIVIYTSFSESQIINTPQAANEVLEDFFTLHQNNLKDALSNTKFN
jgi:EpsI family protein